MKEYGVNESWTKVLSVELLSLFTRFYDFVRPLAYSKSGGEVLLACDNARLLWFDLKSQTVKNDVWIHVVPSSFEADVCLGSLVPLHDGGCDENNQQAQKKDRKGRFDFLSKGFKLVL
ncbi:F-box protein CPR1-like [Cornus florida]|uniref:F-box protein CPR1-like n=1 Tax=Cornus florida TaxID=4283 RepID=UPI0028A058A7|nr:F-box protein CPR1-like [Cornus florida]